MRRLQLRLGGKERWPATLKVFRQALTNAVDEHGIRAWPYGQESGEQKAAPFEKVRAAFYSAYPADGATEAARSEAKRKSFNRAVKMALERSLVGSIELQGIDHLWLVQEGSP